MSDSDSAMHRRGFLGTVIAGAAAVGVASIPGSSKLIAREDNKREKTLFESELAKLASRKHKQVFDTPKPNDAMGVIWSWALLYTHNNLGLADKDVGALVVFRHEAIPFAMQDSLWAKYKFGEIFKITDKATKAPATRNVITNIKPEDMPLPDMAMEKVQARGVVFGVCELAIMVYSMHVAQELKLNPDDVRKEWTAGLLPGIVPLPSGVWAVQKAQESGLTYCFAG